MAQGKRIVKLTITGTRSASDKTQAKMFTETLIKLGDVIKKALRNTSEDFTLRVVHVWECPQSYSSTSGERLPSPLMMVEAFSKSSLGRYVFKLLIEAMKSGEEDIEEDYESLTVDIRGL
jgi:hypothetical protein